MRERALKQYDVMAKLLSMRNEYSSVEHLCENVLPAVAIALNIQRVSVWQFDELRDAMVCRALYSLLNSSISSGSVLLRNNYPKYFEFIESNQIMTADNVYEHCATQEFEETYLRPNRIVSMLDVLLCSTSEKPWGVLCLERIGEVAIAWEADEQTFSLTVSDYLSIEIDRFRHREQATRLFNSQKMESLGRLAGGVAHDFNNILAIIGNSCEILKDTLANNTSQSHSNMLDNIFRAVERGRRLTKQLLVFTKDGINNDEVLDVSEAIREIQGMLEALMPKHIDLRVSLSSEPLKIKIDTGALSQILVNLVVNACDAIAISGAVTIESARCRAPVTNLIPDDSTTIGWVRISVSDNGCGMSEEVRKKCVEPFFTTKPIGQGTGLGLSTTFGLISKANGFMDVYSQPQKGTSIKVYFPLLDESIIPAKSEKSDPIRCNVIIVDDDLDILSTTKVILENMGCMVWSFTSPTKALSFLGASNDHIDVVVSDVMMPEMNGVELADRIKKTDPSIKIILTSGFTDQALADMHLDSSKFSFLSKPYSVQDLRELVLIRSQVSRSKI